MFQCTWKWRHITRTLLRNVEQVLCQIMKFRVIHAAGTGPETGAFTTGGESIISIDDQLRLAWMWLSMDWFARKPLRRTTGTKGESIAEVVSRPVSRESAFETGKTVSRCGTPCDAPKDIR